jgi:hypothetical protein
MNCKYAYELINKNVDGLASPKEKALLERRLSTCSHCSEEYAAVASLDGLLAKALPLQESLGDGFATRVAGRLPARGSRLSILKEAFVMSRMKYVVLAAVVLAIVIGCLFAPRSRNNQALAAVQSAMAQVESLHFRIATPTEPKQPHWQAEVWATRDAWKQTDKNGWRIVKGGAHYYYDSRHKVLFILPARNTAEMFGEMVDPRKIVGLTKQPKMHVSVTVQDIDRDGKPMLQIAVERTGTALKETEVRSSRIWRKMAEILEGQSRAEGTKARGVMVRVVAKQVCLVDPTTNLVQSVEYFAKSRKNDEWELAARVTSINYNVNLPDHFFDVKTPPGTKVYDLRH